MMEGEGAAAAAGLPHLENAAITFGNSLMATWTLKKHLLGETETINCEHRNF
jgi:hypothetical protein